MSHRSGRASPAVLALAANILLTLAASARLNETEAQSLRRYGPPLKTAAALDRHSPVLKGAVNRTYDYKGWRIRVAFLKGKAVRLSYSKHSQPDSSPKMQPDEAAAVLKGESGGGTWKPQGKPLNPTKALAEVLTGYEKWINSNGNLACIRGMSLVVETPAAEAFIQKRVAEIERDRKVRIPEF